MVKTVEELKANDGPIPGENFTSDTKNYPWHRPPEITDIDEAIDIISEKVLTDIKKSSGILTLIEMGMPISAIVESIVLIGVSNGKWTVDFAILLAGPVARIIEMMAKSASIKYVMGTEEDQTPMTMHSVTEFEAKPKKFDAAKAIRSGKEAVKEVKAKGGLGSPEPVMEN